MTDCERTAARVAEHLTAKIVRVIRACAAIAGTTEIPGQKALEMCALAVEHAGPMWVEEARKEAGAPHEDP